MEETVDILRTKFFIGPEVFTPKNMTTMLINKADRQIKKMSGDIKVADFGSGSGFIAIMLKKYNPDIQIHAYEKSPEAYAYLIKNIEYHQLDITPHLIDVMDIDDTGFDAVISNPPYFPNSLKPDIPWFHNEPDMAFYGGEMGYEIPIDFITKAYNVLKPDGYFITSHITDHYKQITDECMKYFRDVEIERFPHPNLADHLCPSFTSGYRA
jgi:release factor glutamine methyltransferase